MLAVDVAQTTAAVKFTTRLLAITNNNSANQSVIYIIVNFIQLRYVLCT